MTKRLCKLKRQDIASSLGEISNLVAEPKFLCHSCARSSSDKSRLCKPQALNVTLSNKEISPKPETLLSKKVIKKARKEAKKQSKYQKKLEKVLKKQRKMAKQHQKLEREFSKANLALVELGRSEVTNQAIH